MTVAAPSAGRDADGESRRRPVLHAIAAVAAPAAVVDRVERRLGHLPRRGLMLGLLAVYLALVAVTMAEHEMWRDELQAWLIARDSDGLAELYRNRAYEGHPYLWYLVLYPAAAVGRDPRLMQALAFVISAATMALLLLRGPFRRTELLLLPFGYLLLFEYGAKARSYMLGCLILFAFCALWSARRRATPWQALLLGLLAHLHVMFLVMAVGAAACVGLDRVLRREPPTRRDAVALAILAVALLTAAASLVPPADRGRGLDWLFGLDLERAKDTLRSVGGLLWPTSWPRQRLAAVLALAVLAVMLVRWRRCPPAVAFLVVSTGGILAFLYLKFEGRAWHHGLVFVILLATLWLARARGAPDLLPRWLVLAVLLVQAGAGLRSVAQDLGGTYSNGRDVARYLEAQGWGRQPLASVGHAAMITVLGYLGRDRVYNAEGRRFGSFIHLDTLSQDPVDLPAFLADVDGFGPCATLVAADLTYSLDPTLLAAHGYREAARFDDAYFSERYVVYRREAGACPATP